MNTQAAYGIQAIPLTRGFNGSQGIIHPVLIWDEHNAILVDTGEPIHLQAVQTAMEQAGIPLARLNQIIMTHQDIDHIGNLPNLLQATPHKIEVLAHEADRPYIEGVKPLMKLKADVLRDKMNALPESELQLRADIALLLDNPPKAGVDRVVADGDTLPYCGGITVIHTPGHTPGHISLYLSQSKTLIAGDAIVIMDGKLRKPVEQFTPDMETAIKSLKKFVNYDVETLICYHGGVFNGNANEALAELAASL
ncbi:MBL fold metallo-hydrolase [Paenibacillus thalictri]|uniref:MBL fold metallo-hydrolase n=1 Tax=Paenibacillus thalictri TaxID=2527873 RepID=A0A4Q9DLN3_9BACL|nr:MBL fold metallo-hydrolase [Paenibacillus thalictri]TBL73338.1 MBL fold metallo-hydrolase [Paenibacillus thalictri]